jgi:hypothetical protein
MHATTSLPESPGAADRAGGAARYFLVATLLFVGLVVTMTVGLSERQSAQDEVARDLGVGLDDIPPDRLADVIRETWSTPAVLLIGVLALVSTVVYARGMVVLGSVARSTVPGFVLAVTGSLVLAVVRLWPTGVARRTSVVVLLLAVVLTALSVTAGAPPILPLVLATVFAHNVRRALLGARESAYLPG